MLFIPLPLFVTILLSLLLGRFVRGRDMSVRAHQMFAAVVALYAVQSLLASLRWGYGVEGAAVSMAVLAPVLPVLTYTSYMSLAGAVRLWPLVVILGNWVVLAVAPSLADPLIMLTYIGFGALVLQLWRRGADALTRAPINDARSIAIAMLLTGLALIASAVTDGFLIYDFVVNDGRHAGLVLTFVQTVFGLAVGVSAVMGRASAQAEQSGQPAATQDDAQTVALLEELFTRGGLHLSEDVSLRRLSRKLGVPDRQVSQAVNRVRGVSVSQFVNDFRIKDACALLTTTEKSVLDVSLAAGFATKSNFNREFMRVTGKTPSQWRLAAST